MERDTTRDAVYGQITVNAKLVARRPDDLGRLKRYQRMALGIEEARAAQISVPLLVPRLDGRSLDFDRNTRLRKLVGIQHERAAHDLESASHVGDHHVPNFKVSRRVRRIHGPR